MRPVLIIGYGNPLRGDDSVGFQAAARLAQLIAGPDVEVLAMHQLTPELADPISRAARVIFIDAAAEGAPGSIHRRAVQPAPARAAFTHQATPGGLLAAAQALFGRAPEGILYSLPGHSFELGEILSPPVQQALDRLVVELAAELAAPGEVTPPSSRPW